MWLNVDGSMGMVRSFCYFFRNTDFQMWEGNRHYKMLDMYFEKEVEVFTASRDPFKRKLYKVSDLATKMGSSTNRVCSSCFFEA
jgi:hypothetical protein